MNNLSYPLSAEVMESLQKFQSRLHADPSQEGISPTPDRKANTLVISHVEMTLDELFFGQWSTRNFQWSAIANEVQGSIELVAVHPVSGRELTRIGAASVIIMVDRVPDDIKSDPQARNEWALNPSNKKANALDLSFPKLKAECLKNAAQSLGKIFGRDLNRMIADRYQPFRISQKSTGLSALPESTICLIEQQIRSGLSPWELNREIEALQELITQDQIERLQKLFCELNPEQP
jgi:hypothetical protein